MLLSQILSTLLLYVWVCYYVIILAVTPAYGSHGPPTSDQDLHNLQMLGTSYGVWLWGYVVVTGVLSVRVVRYMRIHAGLRAFYQVLACSRPRLLQQDIVLRPALEHAHGASTG
jgi:hypothetical protein